MAAIDKIYGTRDQWFELHAWLSAFMPIATKYLYPMPSRWAEGDRFPISNFPTWVDIALYEECELEWVKAAIKEQYNGGPEHLYNGHAWRKWDKDNPPYESQIGFVAWRSTYSGEKWVQRDAVAHGYFWYDSEPTHWLPESAWPKPPDN